MQVLAFSGGKDSTALALRLHELGETFTMLFTPTGDELPELTEHIDLIQKITDAPLVKPPNRSLDFWIRDFNALPNWRQRWCTRAIKIEPCVAYLKANPGSTLIVGLRADEEERQGLYGDFATYRYPLREWGWGIKEVVAYNESRGIQVPARTDCALCYGQRIDEWYSLWKQHPGKWAEGEAYEEMTGHTFRSAQRDTWPASMKGLREEFESGRKPRRISLPQAQQSCRVCRS